MRWKAATRWFGAEIAAGHLPAGDLLYAEWWAEVRGRRIRGARPTVGDLRCAAKHKLLAALADVCGMSELLRILPISAPKRRSDRVSIGFPIEVVGVGAEGERFNESTTT
ncbi:MAG TPA: hypothetical protein VF753_10445, partial [Terriglobales bacterium]